MSGSAFRYGAIEHVDPTAEVKVSERQNIVDWKDVNKHKLYTQSIRVQDVNKAHVEFLKLMDEHKAGDITDFGIRCYAGKDGKIHRIEKVWMKG